METLEAFDVIMRMVNVVGIIFLYTVVRKVTSSMDKVERHEKTLYGNGQEGLETKVTKLEARFQSHVDYQRSPTNG